MIGTVETAGSDDPMAWALEELRREISQQLTYGSELVDVLLAVGRDKHA
ncbi:hypothetical protein ACIBM8_30465 [Micromonospora aurantiaca]